jgi:hypothetical protein
MITVSETKSAAAAQPTVRDTGRCEMCGAYTDQQVADRTICPTCYEAHASCCNELDGERS